MALIALFWVSGCSVDTAQSHYVLAEKLWTDRKYEAAVSEFEKVISKDPRGKLGLLALYRAASTQSLFLAQYADAVKKLRAYVQRDPEEQAVWEAQIEIGDILFTKTEQYDQAIQHYETLLKDKPSATEAPFFLFRVGKSLFFLLHFRDAVGAFERLLSHYPKSKWVEQAAFQIAVCYFTEGEQQAGNGERTNEAYEKALQAYQQFVEKFPKSVLVPEARFGVAACLEEKGQFEKAYEIYTTLTKDYPSPRVIEIKLARLKERMHHKLRTK